MLRGLVVQFSLFILSITGFCISISAQEMKILREMDRDPLLSAATGLLPNQAGEALPPMKDESSKDVQDFEADDGIGDTIKRDGPLFVGDGDAPEESKGGKVDAIGNSSANLGRPSNTLGVIDGETDEATSVVNIRLSKKIDWKEVALENHNTYLQIPLPHTLIPESGKFIDINNPYFTKAAAFQITPDRGAVRLFLSREFSSLESGLHTDILNDRIVVTLDHGILEKSGIFDHVQKVGVKGTPQVDEVIAKTEVRSDIPDPATMLRSQKRVEEKTITVPENLQQKTRLVAIFSAVIFVAFVGLSLTRTLMLRLKASPNKDGEYVMKTIASSHLAPKHKLTLMQIGGEKILLSVSPDGIRYLTTIGAKEQIGSRVMALEGTADTERRRLPGSLVKKLILAAAGLGNKGIGVENKCSVGSLSGDGVGKRNSGQKMAGEESPITLLDDKATRGKRVNAIISDEGIKDIRCDSKEMVAEEARNSTKAIEDVTTLIRKKIKNLPKL